MSATHLYLFLKLITQDTAKVPDTQTFFLDSDFPLVVAIRKIREEKDSKPLVSQDLKNKKTLTTLLSLPHL